MFRKSEKVVVLDDWPHPEAGAPMPKVFANDSRFVLRYYTQEGKIAVISFPLANIFTFGSPNDEAIRGHRLAKDGFHLYCVHEVLNSAWIEALEKSNSVHPRHNKSDFLKNKHHFLFSFHDSTLEVVATTGDYWSPIIKVASTEEEAKKYFEEAQNA